MGKRVLFLSNGHGEDLNASLILQQLQRQHPEIEVAAMPIVGEGNAYRRLGVKIIGPTQQLPSGGFNYINLARFLNPVNWLRDSNPLNLVRDLLAGLPALTWGQWQAVKRYSRDCDLLFATGDIVPILFAYCTQRPFMAFLVSNSSYYEGRIKLPLPALLGLRSHRCRQIFTRDAFTAQDLQSRGLKKTAFAGYPIMDVLNPSGQDLALSSALPMIALLPGSRLPEAIHNFALQLRLCEAVAQRQPMEFRAALVAKFTATDLAMVADAQGWDWVEGEKGYTLRKGNVQVVGFHGAFADILHQCDLAVGMAGTAVEQAVGLGKPVVQIIGPGPQFTYPFAEAQMRLLGPSVVTVGNRMATASMLEQAADKIVLMLQDASFQQRCIHNGKERVGPPGGSANIARQIVNVLADHA